ncbi:AAA family ATPase [Naasia lichenicola]|uniref:Nuclease SbcCD subunit C n=1 Tax=Naasia lichenicola TaxID=2565933 RepID=A0A4S4FRQ0_9MICO|nr:SMC family ATPase [Naasia lichenicola]THG33333.1 SMC family ATPase [Naasia lichenicola]
MRINRVELAGFGPFRGVQKLDFDAFRDDGIFLIEGRTGAGKSSILDAICFALYGSAPRYEKTEAHLRSDHCGPDDPTYVTLEFTAGEHRYLVTRSPEYERPKKRGAGTTKTPASAELFIQRDGEWVGVAARAVDVGNELDTVVGLRKDQFLQVILLAQNRFQRFLQAGNDDRQAVLRSLFGTRRFEEYEQELTVRSKALQAELETSAEFVRREAARAARLAEPDGSLDLPTEVGDAWFAELSGILDAELADAAQKASDSDLAFTTADSALRAAELLAGRHRRREAAAAAALELEALRPTISSARAEHDAAVRASTVWPYVERSRATRSAADRAVAAEQTARLAFDELCRGLAAVPDPRALRHALSDEMGALRAVLADEQGLPGLRGALDAQRSAIAALEVTLQADALLLHDLPLRLETIDFDLIAVRNRAATRPAADAQVARLDAAHAASARVTALETDLRQLQDREALAGTQLSGLHRAHADLLARRWAGHAAELAANLAPGEACVVCGSLEHPAPAALDADAVSAEDLARSERLVAEATASLAAASAAVRDGSELLAVERTRAGEVPLDELAAQLESARSTQRACLAAVADVRRLEGESAAVRRELDDAKTLQGQRASDLQKAQLAAASTAARLDDTIARLQAARGNDPSIAAKLERLRGQHDAAVALIESITAVDDARTAALDASQQLTAALAEKGFGSEDDVDAAHRTDRQIALLADQVRSFDAAEAATSAALSDPELVDLPEQTESIADLGTAKRVAGQQRDMALAAHAAVSGRRDQLASLIDELSAEQADTAELRAQYDQVRELAAVVQGNEPNSMRMRLETYVLAAELEEIVSAANVRLRTMTSGRYALEHDDSRQYRNTRSGLGLSILDQHTGRARATHSLSGGETFLASLALALGLAEVVSSQAGGITLDTLFVDEGFGSLDEDTLGIAMSTLDSLRSGGRTIGLISHVNTMKEQIPAKVRIRVTDDGSSEVVQDALSAVGSLGG